MGECVIARRGGKEFHVPTFAQSETSTFNCETLGDGYFLIAAIDGGASALYLQDESHRIKMYHDTTYATRFESFAVVRLNKTGSSYNIYVIYGDGTAEQLLLTGVTSPVLINGAYSAVYKMD